MVKGLHAFAEVIGLTPSLEEMEGMDDDQLPYFDAVLASSYSAKSFKSKVLGPDLDRIELTRVTDVDVSSGLGRRADTIVPQNTLIRAEATLDTQATQHAFAKPTVRKSQTVRVDVELLETLMNLVGELVIDHTRVERVHRMLTQRYRQDEHVRALADVSSHISRVVSELQENVMSARMLPIDALFDRFPRIVRDLAKTLDKEVELVLEGRETRLDRTVIEEIADPLIHLVRNAVDHGLESVVDRIAAGKDATGRVLLRAFQEDNKVVITVTDDGVGMDAAHIAQSAVKKGIIDTTQMGTLSREEALQLIFRAGFSTASVVSDVSGRGVGMDIVRSNIEKLSGTIEIETERGRGTTFKIRLPLTLAIVPGLLVAVEGRTFVLPLSSVTEIIRIAPTEIQSVCQKPSIRHRGTVLQIAYLRDFLHLPREVMDKPLVSVVVVESGHRSIGLVVDEMKGNQEIVKKSLGTALGDVSGIAGATILGDGQVGLILDVPRVCQLAGA